MAGLRVGSPLYASYADPSLRDDLDLPDAHDTHAEDEWRKKDAGRFRPPYSTRTGRIAMAFLFTLMMWRATGGGQFEDAAATERGFALRSQRDHTHPHTDPHPLPARDTDHHRAHEAAHPHLPAIAFADASPPSLPQLSATVLPTAQYAYATLVAVENDVDGAIALGESLKRNSQLVAKGGAVHVCITPRGRLSEASTTRLVRLGCITAEVDDVARAADGGPTGARSHLDAFHAVAAFGLTQFRRVVVTTVDVLAVRNPDAVFDLDIPDGAWVAALAARHVAFQTGVLAFRPAAAVHDDLWLRLRREADAGSAAARDAGTLLRQFFGDKHVALAKSFVAHIPARREAFDDIVFVHFRGPFKPWHNPADEAALQLVRDKQEAPLGLAYAEWWRYYDIGHRAELEDDDGSAWGPTQPDPRTHYWMCRHTPTEFVRPSIDAVARARDVITPGTAVVVGDDGASCDSVCATRSRDIYLATKSSGNSHAFTCDSAGLKHLYLSNCSVMQRAFETPSALCKHNYHWTDDVDARDAAPYYDMSTLAVVMNAALDPRKEATCDAAAAGVRRLCPCIAEGRPTEPVPWDGDAGKLTVVPSALVV